jgi:hypothetical protein
LLGFAVVPGWKRVSGKGYGNRCGQYPKEPKQPNEEGFEIYFHGAFLLAEKLKAALWRRRPW